MPEYAAVTPGRTGVLFPRGDIRKCVDQTWEFVASSNPQTVAEWCVAEIQERWTPERQAAMLSKAVENVCERNLGAYATTDLGFFEVRQ
ncbi:hypothetical protein GCM10027572_04300 [Flexivirga lutea]